MKKEIRDPAVMAARKQKDTDFRPFSYWDKVHKVASFGRSRVLKGQCKTKPKKK